MPESRVHDAAGLALILLLCVSSRCSITTHPVLCKQVCEFPTFHYRHRDVNEKNNHMYSLSTHALSLLSRAFYFLTGILNQKVW